MPRIARIVIPGCAHHIVQRGNNRQDVFFVDDDRQLYLRLLIEESRNHGLEVLAYCLMSNHVHLIAVPAGEESLAKGFGRANSCLPAGRSGTPRRSTAFTAAAGSPLRARLRRARPVAEPLLFLPVGRGALLAGRPLFCHSVT